MCGILFSKDSKNRLDSYSFNQALLKQSWRGPDAKGTSKEKFDAFRRYSFYLMFVGDDWYKTEKWEDIEKKFSSHKVKIIYFPYTNSVSSTLINETLIKLREEN